MLTISIYIFLLLILVMIGAYNLIYSIRLKKVKLQIGVELPGISIILLRISTFIAVVSFFIITYMALSAR